MDQSSRVLCRVSLGLAQAARWFALAWIAGGLVRPEVVAQPQSPALVLFGYLGFTLGPIAAAFLFLILDKQAGPRLALLPGIISLLGAWWAHARQPVEQQGLFLPSFALAWLSITAWRLEADMALVPWRFFSRERALRLVPAITAAAMAIHWRWNCSDWHPSLLDSISFTLPWLALLPVAMVHRESRPPAHRLPAWPDSWEAEGLSSGFGAGSLALAMTVVALLARGVDPLGGEWLLAAGGGALLGALVNVFVSQPGRQTGLFPIGMAFFAGGLLLFWPCGAWCPFASGVSAFGLSLAASAWICCGAPRMPYQPRPWFSFWTTPWMLGFVTSHVALVLDMGRFSWGWYALVCLGIAVSLAWALKRAAIELILEIFLMPTYRFRTAGPGLDALPASGPVLLVSNHTTYTDPFWIGKVLPRRFIPMMTSVFYDLPGIRFLMKEVVGAIRVPAAVARKTAPELDEASAVLEKGGTVLIFPEGTLRKVEEPSTKLFGRGVAMLVQKHPDATVIPVWIEGGWGAYFSYAGGPPGKNKKRDFNRPIHLAFGQPLTFSPEEMADQRILRRRLRSEVHACRALLGLEIPRDKPGAPSTADDLEPAAE